MYTRVLILHGGGSMAFFTLGALKEIASLVKVPLYQKFDLIYATSTGAIIGMLIALGFGIDEIYQIYRTEVRKIMSKKRKKTRSLALNRALNKILGNRTSADLKTDLSIVSTCWDTYNPVIFKSNHCHAYKCTATFISFFGIPLSDALEASCSAYPLFNRKIITTSDGKHMELYDGGYCANNPILFAIGDTLGPMRVSPNKLRIIDIGVGIYPEPKSILRSILKNSIFIKYSDLHRQLAVNTQLTEKLFNAQYSHIERIYINSVFHEQKMATDLLECNLTKLNRLHTCGREAFGREENKIKEFLL